MHIYAIILQRRNALICSFIKCALIFRALKDPKLYDALRLEIAISSLSKFFLLKLNITKNNKLIKTRMTSQTISSHSIVKFCKVFYFRKIVNI